MADQEDSERLPAFDRFAKVWEEIFEFLPESKTWLYHPERIENRHIALMLAWPGILTITFAALTGEKEISELLAKSADSLGEDDDLDQLEKNPAVINKIINKIYLLTKSNSPHISQNLNRELAILISNYILICYILADSLNVDEINSIFTIGDIVENLHAWKLSNSTSFYISLISICWLFLSSAYCQAKITDFFSHKEEIDVKESIPIPSKNLVIQHAINIKDGSCGSGIVESSSDEDNLGFAINLLHGLSASYELWKVEYGPEELVDDFYFFHYQNNTSENMEEKLIIWLYNLAKKSSELVNNIVQNWDNFLTEPADTVNNDIEKFISWFDHILKSKNELNDVLEWDKLRRLFLLSDVEFKEDDRITSKRKKLKTEYKKHIPPWLQEILIKANDEIDVLYKFAKVNAKRSKFGEHDNHEEDLKKIVVNYYKNNNVNFQYIKLEDVDDMRFDFSTNDIRDTKRFLLERISLNFGIFTNKSKIFQILGLPI